MKNLFIANINLDSRLVKDLSKQIILQQNVMVGLRNKLSLIRHISIDTRHLDTKGMKKEIKGMRNRGDNDTTVSTILYYTYPIYWSFYSS